MTPKWVIGTDFVAASNQVFFGDEGNVDAPLGGYGRVNVHSSYNVHRACAALRPHREPVRHAVRNIRHIYQSRPRQQAGPGCGGSNDDADNCHGTGNDPTRRSTA
ncbi:MAG: hypothetical protein WDN31_03835 [Hyphomicrobium sp.]